MKYQSMCRICPVCGKHRGGNTDHTACSKVMQKKRQHQERHRKTRPAEVSKLFKDFQYHEMNGPDLAEIEENALDYRALERFKSSSQG